MPLNFPATPVTNQSYSYGNTTWTFNGSGWIISAGVTPATTAGGDLTGTYPNPTVGANVAKFSSGTFASRPAASRAGAYYFATDTSRLYLDTGTSWVEVASGTDSVTSAMIAADAVGSSEIAADAVGSSEIAADAVGSSEIAAGAVGTSELASAVGNFGAWSYYLPTITGSSSNPTIGSGDGLWGYYCQIGKTVHGRIYWYYGGGGSIGSGYYIFSLPVPTVDYLGGGIGPIGFCMVTDFSPAAEYIGVVVRNGTSAVTIRGYDSSLWGSSAPRSANLASGDKIQLNFTYEAA